MNRVLLIIFRFILFTFYTDTTVFLKTDYILQMLTNSRRGLPHHTLYTANRIRSPHVHYKRKPQRPPSPPNFSPRFQSLFIFKSTLNYNKILLSLEKTIITDMCSAPEDSGCDPVRIKI